ncbi:MAG: YHYH protein [Actinomycetota bacterium]
MRHHRSSALIVVLCAIVVATACSSGSNQSADAPVQPSTDDAAAASASDGDGSIAAESATTDAAATGADTCMTGVDSALVTCGDDSIVIESTGLPSHELMVGIAAGAWNGQWPAEQGYTGANAFVVPTAIELTDDPAYSVMNVAGVTANGVPFFFPHAPGRAGSDTCIELPDSWVAEGECLRDPVAVGEMDDCGGHTGRGDDYHYHAEPTCLIDQMEPGAIVGYMLDGVPIYAEPLAGSVEYDGCSGWVSPAGVIHHAFQDSYPYLTDCMLGTFAEGPRTQGAEVDAGGLDTRQLGAITAYDEADGGCHTMTFADGTELSHCHS